MSVWSVLVPAGKYDGSICAVCRHGGRCKCQIANTMDQSVQCVGMVGPSASWRIRWIDLCSVSAWRYRRYSITSTDRSIVFAIWHLHRPPCRHTAQIDPSYSPARRWSWTFSVTAARVWNALPSSVCSAPSLLQFHRDLKTALFLSS